MTNETQQTNAPETKQPIPFGGRLKTAREALGLDRKDAAAQLRLNEKIIIMMEKDRYPSDLPVTFIRGYIRAYGKLLQIPEYEIKKAIEPIKQKPTHHEPLTPLEQSPQSGGYFMQFFTYLVMFTLVGLVGVWWYTHPTQNNLTAENQPSAAPALATEQLPPPQPILSQPPSAVSAPAAPTMATNNVAQPATAPTPVTGMPSAMPSTTATSLVNPPAPAASDASSDHATPSQTTDKPAYLRKAEAAEAAEAADDSESEEPADENRSDQSHNNENNEPSTDNAEATD